MNITATMTSKDRVLAFLNGDIPDRVPTHYRGTNEVTQKLLDYFETDNFGVVKKKLGIDGWQHVSPEYIGPEMGRFEDGSWESCWGTRYKTVPYQTGAYAEKFFYPLIYANKIKDLDCFRWPDVNWWDFSQMPRVLKQSPDLIVNAGYYSLFEKYNDLRPLEECLADLLCEPEFVHEVFQRLHNYWMKFSGEIFRLNRGNIHMTIISDDVGMQDRMMIRPSVWREFFPQYYKEYIAMAHSYGVKVIYHSDGAMEQIIPDLIECGVDVLDPVQHRCPGMDRQSLKDKYGDSIGFTGAVENQHVLPFGSVQDVEEETRECMRTLGKGGGYMLSSCHRIQPITPVENIIAMYRVVQEEGDRYF